MEIILSHEKLPNKKAEILKRLKGNTNFINNRAMLIDSTDNGKKYIICLDSQKNEADFLRLSYKYYNSSPKKLSSENEKKKLYIIQKMNYAINYSKIVYLEKR